jgi:hypothetical protein
MALSKTDTDKKIMKSENGTTCLITQAGEADRLMELARKREINRKKFLGQPMDSWEI